jgi:hypothetical protein
VAERVTARVGEGGRAGGDEELPCAAAKRRAKATCASVRAKVASIADPAPSSSESERREACADMLAASASSSTSTAGWPSTVTWK